MTGIELAVGYALAWVFRKGRRVAGQLDGEVDRVADAGVRYVHDLVSGALGEAPALAQARQEAEAGRLEAGEQLRLQLVRAVAEQVKRDPAFGEALGQAVAAVRDEPTPTSAPAPAPAPAPSISVSVQNNNGGVVAGQLGDITINPQLPGPAQS
ncbi:hypothetical protein [Streptomyces sp. Adlamb9]|uniref:hypothetical protein n=1 Tax=Streptomyces sp. Adlamb9 TaxID=3400629 RepID=UPI003F1A1D5A